MPEKRPELDQPIANFEAERQLLGRLMLENNDYWRVAGLLHPEHFYTLVHTTIYEKIQQLIESDQKATPVTLASYLPLKIGRENTVRYLLALVKDATTSINVPDYARTIVALALRREIITGSQNIISQATAVEISTPVVQIIESADMVYSNIRAKIPEALRDQTSISIVSEDAYERLKIMMGNPSIHPTIGLKGVTRLMGPLAPGCVYILAGRPGSGKTAAAVAAARSVMRQTGPDQKNYGVAFFTLEVTKFDLWNRFIACEMALSMTPVSYMNIKRAVLEPHEFEAVGRFNAALKKFPLSIDDKSRLTVPEIYARARAEKQKLEKQGIKLSLVVVDYLQIIKPAERYQGNKVAEISDISSGLVQLAKDLDVAVLAVSQLSRKVEERNDKRPLMSDLRESGQIEQDANSVILLYRPAYYDNQKTSEADAELLDTFAQRENDLYYIVAKARDGTTGEYKALCDIGKNHIYE